MSGLKKSGPAIDEGKERNDDQRRAARVAA